MVVLVLSWAVIPSFCVVCGLLDVWSLWPPSTVSPVDSASDGAVTATTSSVMCSFLDRAFRAAFELHMSQCVLFPNDFMFGLRARRFVGMFNKY